jgi:hypothetical protein
MGGRGLVATRWLQGVGRGRFIGGCVLCLLLRVGYRIVCGKIAAAARGQLGEWVCRGCARGVAGGRTFLAWLWSVAQVLVSGLFWVKAHEI